MKIQLKSFPVYHASIHYIAWKFDNSEPSVEHLETLIMGFVLVQHNDGIHHVYAKSAIQRKTRLLCLVGPMKQRATFIGYNGKYIFNAFARSMNEIVRQIFFYEKLLNCQVFHTIIDGIFLVRLTFFSFSNLNIPNAYQSICIIYKSQMMKKASLILETN